jgi:hypothetical protein
VGSSRWAIHAENVITGFRCRSDDGDGDVGPGLRWGRSAGTNANAGDFIQGFSGIPGLELSGQEVQ